MTTTHAHATLTDAGMAKLTDLVHAAARPWAYDSTWLRDELDSIEYLAARGRSTWTVTIQAHTDPLSVELGPDDVRFRPEEQFMGLRAVARRLGITATELVFALEASHAGPTAPAVSACGKWDPMIVDWHIRRDAIALEMMF